MLATKPTPFGRTFSGPSYEPGTKSAGFPLRAVTGGGIGFIVACIDEEDDEASPHIDSLAYDPVLFDEAI